MENTEVFKNVLIEGYVRMTVFGKRLTSFIIPKSIYQLIKRLLLEIPQFTHITSERILFYRINDSKAYFFYSAYSIKPQVIQLNKGIKTIKPNNRHNNINPFIVITNDNKVLHYSQDEIKKPHVLDVNFLGKLNKTSVLDISTGPYHCALINSENQLYIEGMNNKGQIGMSSPAKEFKEFTKHPFNDRGFKILNVFCADSSTFLRLKTLHNGNDKIYVTGDNQYGKLGLKTVDNQYGFTQILTNVIIKKCIKILTNNTQTIIILSRQCKLQLYVSNSVKKMFLLNKEVSKKLNENNGYIIENAHIDHDGGIIITARDKLSLAVKVLTFGHFIKSFTNLINSQKKGNIINGIKQANCIVAATLKNNDTIDIISIKKNNHKRFDSDPTEDIKTIFTFK